MPGGDGYGSGWTDSSGNFWLFGGWASIQTAMKAISTTYGSSIPRHVRRMGVDGRKQLWALRQRPARSVRHRGNILLRRTFPVGSRGASSWTDSSGNFWLFGGIGLDVSGGGLPPVVLHLNDLWEYNPSKRMGMDGRKQHDHRNAGWKLGQPGEYGTLGSACCCQHSRRTLLGLGVGPIAAATSGSLGGPASIPPTLRAFSTMFGNSRTPLERQPPFCRPPHQRSALRVEHTPGRRR